ncbi:cell division cycle-associated protein 2 isoform X2 [Trichomycterus rosablanca]
MAAFQRLMGMDEENIEQAAVLMKEDVGESFSKDVQPDNQHLSDEDQENRLVPSSFHPPVTPPLSKRRRRFPSNRGSWEDGIQEEPLSELPLTSRQEEQMCPPEFKSPKPAPGLGSDSQSRLISSPMLSKPALIKTGDVEVPSVSKKRVRFGAPLSPEFFDKTLPPSTPLQRGATPAPPPSSTGRKHSLLKTPQRFEPRLPQPDFGSPARSGASPVLASRDPADNDEVFMDSDKIAFPSMDEEDDNALVTSNGTLLTEGPESSPHHESLAIDTELMNAAFQEDEELSLTAHQSAPTEPKPDSELIQSQPGQQKSTAACPEAPRSRGRKRKQPAENETETRRSSRSAAASAKGKMKTSAAKKRFGSKEVDRSLYGKRDYASKNPLLSPIVESTPSSLSGTPLQVQTGQNPDSSPDTSTNIQRGKAAQSGATANLVTAAALWRSRFLEKSKSSQQQPTMEDVPLTNPTDEGTSSDAPADKKPGTSKASRGRRGSSGCRRRSGNARAARTKAPDDGQKEAHASPSEKRRRKDEEQQRESEDTAGSGNEPGKETLECEINHQSESGEAQTRRESSREEEISHSEESVGAGELDRISDEQSRPRSPNLSGQVRVQRGRRSCRVTLSDAGEENQDRQAESSKEQSEERREVERTSQNVSEPLKSVEEARVQNEGRTDGEKLEFKLESNEGTSRLVLEPWQQPEFNIEDVLRPVARARASVRRSLRHRRSTDVQAAGLAWVDHTSPQTSAANQRRRTRGRLSAVSQPPPSDPEENPGR